MNINIFLCALLFCPPLCAIPTSIIEHKQSDQKSNNDNTEVKDNGAKVYLKVDSPANSSPSSVKNDVNKSGKSPPLIVNHTTSVAKTDKVLNENSDVPESNSSQVESGTVIRGVLVFGGLGLIFLIYVGVKTYRRRKKLPIIKKYGVRGRRSDVEMRPLPLDDDEEDETVFDLTHLSKP